MTNNYAIFTEPLSKRIKTAVETVEKTDVLFPPENKARILSGYTSPVAITGGWMLIGGTWACRARRLWRINGVYKFIDDGVEFDLYHPTSGEQPSLGIGERVFAVFRGVWELVSGAAVGGSTPPPSENETTATVILPICRAFNANAKGDWAIPFGNTYQTQHNSRSHFAAQTGYIAIDGKSYSPAISHTENNATHYYKALRVSRDVDPLATVNANAHYVVVSEDRTDILQRPIIVYDDDTANEWTPWADDFSWETTTDIDKAWIDYDIAACPTLDYSEVLVPGERVKVLRTETHDYRRNESARYRGNWRPNDSYYEKGDVVTLLKPKPPTNLTCTEKVGYGFTFQWNGIIYSSTTTYTPHYHAELISHSEQTSVETNIFLSVAPRWYTGLPGDSYTFRVRTVIDGIYGDWTEISCHISTPNFSISFTPVYEQPAWNKSQWLYINNTPRIMAQPGTNDAVWVPYKDIPFLHDVAIVEPPNTYNVEFEGTAKVNEFGIWHKERKITNNQSDVVHTTIDASYNIGQGTEPYDYWGFDTVDLLPNGLACWNFLLIAALPVLTKIQNPENSNDIDDSHVSRPIVTDEVHISNTACNMRAYGLWYKTDRDGVRYPILCNVESLTYGTCIETKKHNCYVLNAETQECEQVWKVFKIKIERENDRLVLPTVYCAINCS